MYIYRILLHVAKLTYMCITSRALSISPGISKLCNNKVQYVHVGRTNGGYMPMYVVWIATFQVNTCIQLLWPVYIQCTSGSKLSYTCIYVRLHIYTVHSTLYAYIVHVHCMYNVYTLVHTLYTYIIHVHACTCITYTHLYVLYIHNIMYSCCCACQAGFQGVGEGGLSERILLYL